MPSDLYIDRVEFQLRLDEMFPKGGWLEVMSLDESPTGYPSAISTGIMGPVGRVVCMEALVTERPQTPNLWRIMFDFNYLLFEETEDWDILSRPWTCWTDGRITRAARREGVYTWRCVDEDGGAPHPFRVYVDSAPTGNREVTDGHRRVGQMRVDEFFPHGLVAERVTENA